MPRDRKTIGEVIVMGDQVMDGYFGDPDATRAAMSGPWLHTGDMAVWDEDGFIQIVDRKKQIIISGGENISSLEVEAAICAHPAVLECAVVAAPDPKWGEVPAAIVVLKDNESLTLEDLLSFLRKRLSRFKLPRIVEFSSDPLPKTGTGKIRKNELRERFWAKQSYTGSGLMVFVRLENVDDLVTLRLWEAGTLGITEGDGFVDAFFEDAEVATQFGEPQAVIDIDWVARTQESFPPLLVGEKFFVAAPWRTEPTPPGRMRLVINPGSAVRHRLSSLHAVVPGGDGEADSAGRFGAGRRQRVGHLVSCGQAAGSRTRRLMRHRSGCQRTRVLLCRERGRGSIGHVRCRGRQHQ